MRAKLTAKHPRPASPRRAPVRPSSPSARKTPRSRDTAPVTPSGKPATQRAAADAAPRKPRDDSSAKAPRARATERPANDARRRASSEGEARAPRAPRGEGSGARPANRAGGADKPRSGASDRNSRNGQSDRFARDERPMRNAGERSPRGDRPLRSAAERTPREAGSGATGARKTARPVKQGAETPHSPVARREGAGTGRSAAGGKAGGRERPASSEARGRPAAGKRVDAARTNAKGAPTRAAAKPARTAPNAANRAESSADHDEGLVRLSKRMSELGLCSRREADEWIENGWVRVDGERIDTLGTRIRPDQHIEITRDAHAAQSRQVTILLHKPIGYVSGQAEDGYEPAITLVTAANRWEGDRATTRFLPSHLRALAPAGRLDIDSTGLLVLTQDGRIAKQLIGENSSVEKEYLVRVTYGDHTTDIDRHFPADQLALLRFGLSLDDAPLKPAKVSWQNGEQLRFVLREGKKRQIRRMCELVGLHVVGLKRVRMGRVALGPLPQGQWRYLLPDEAF